MSTNMSRLTRIAGAVVLSGVLIATIGCSSKNSTDSGGNPTPTDDIVLNFNPPVQVVNQDIVVTATVTSGGAPAANVDVVFTATPVGVGTFTEDTVTTDSDGQAVTVFHGNTVGAATISANASAVGLSKNGSTSFTATDQGGGNANISITRPTGLVLANGRDTTQLTIIVTDQNGNPAPDNTQIVVVAGERFIDMDGNGVYDPTDSLIGDNNGNGEWDAIGQVDVNHFVSGGNGSVTVEYVSGTEATTVWVKATAAGFGLNAADDYSFNLSPNATLTSIYISSDSVSLSVQGTGGIETGLIRATGLDEFGNTVPAGIPLDFIIVDGPGGGERLESVGAGPYTAVTNSNGVATCPISSGTVSGTVKIRVSGAGAVQSQNTYILIAAGPPANIVVGAEECNVRYWDVVNGRNPVVAVVSDIYNNPVNDSTVVYFTTDEGQVMSHMARTMGGDGVAESEWISGEQFPGTADGNVLIIAETDGGNVIDTGNFYNSFLTDTLICSGVPTNIMADGEFKYYVNVTGLDFQNHPVIDGITYRGEATWLAVTGGTMGDGCYGSWDRSSVTSVTLKVDYSTTGGVDDGIGAVDIIRFWSAEGAISVFPCTLRTAEAYRGSSSINGPSNAGPGDVLDFSVTIADRFGNPLGDHTLNMTATGGSVAGATQETNAYGEASGFRWTAPAGLGDYTISVADTDPRGAGIVLTLTVTVE